MAIKGSLKEASLPDVLQLLSMGQKTGCLSIAERNNFGYIYFETGQIVYASIVNRRDRLGDILVKNGLVTPEQLQSAVEAQGHRRDKRLGELLVEMNALTRPALENYMRIQIEEAVYYLFTWTSGTFSFETDVRPERQDFLVRISPESLLLEGARRVDEWSLIEKKIPSFDLIFVVERQRLASSGVTLTPEQERLATLVDGRRDVEQLVEDSGMLEFDVAKALYGLIAAGFAHRLGRTRVEAVVAPVPAGRVEEHRNLGLAFYKTAMFGEALREFKRVVELAPGDQLAHFFLGLVALRQGRPAEAVEALRDAAERVARPAVLHDLAVALEQVGRFAEADAAFEEAAARAPADARVVLGWGVCAVRAGRGAEAVERLDRARALLGGKTPGALWYWARALAAVVVGSPAEAVPVLEEGIERYPHSAPLWNNLAALHEQAGDLDRAEKVARLALEEDPSLPQVSKNIGDLCYRGGRVEEAQEAYARAVKLAPRLGDDVYFKLGNIAFKEMRQQEAVEFWREAVALNPGHSLAQANLSTVERLAPG
jgi:tetratricopeptide (TPR) repeat protein